jgi:hypothetical protein
MKRLVPEKRRNSTRLARPSSREPSPIAELFELVL